MRHWLYPLFDYRSLLFGVIWLVVNVSFFLVWLLTAGVTMWDSYRGTTEVSPLVGVVVTLMFGFALFSALVGTIYVGTLVAANREGWKRSGRLPAPHLKTLLRDGVVAMLFSSLCTLIPYYGLCLLLILSGGAAFGVTRLASEFNETLGMLAGLLSFGGIGLAMFLGLSAFVVFAMMTIPLLQARYAATGQVGSYFRFLWVFRAIAIAPGRYVLYQLPTLIYLAVSFLLYVVTLGLGAGLVALFFPFVQLNQAYLVGRYYGEYVDPSLSGFDS